MSFNRRSFLKSFGVAAGSLIFNPLDFFHHRSYASSPLRASVLANRAVNFEGSWVPKEIEGVIPESLLGTLYRVGPGCKNVATKKLTHFFDGDSYLTAIHFNGGKVSVTSRFVETEERKKELLAGKMLYNDFGTATDGLARGFKNPPNINVQKIAGELLVFSEAGHPTRVDPATLECRGLWNFNNTLPFNASFTAHPRTDLKSGKTYVYGISRAMNPKLKIYEIDKNSGSLLKIGSIKLGGFYPVHDMMITENHIVIAVPPVKINMLGAATYRKPVADLLEFEPEKPMRIFVVRKDGSGEPIEFESPDSGMIFHHLAAYEENNQITFFSAMMEDFSVFELFKNWEKPTPAQSPRSWITKFILDLKSRRVLSLEKISDGTPTDFPCAGDAEDVFILEVSDSGVDPLAFDTLVKWDLETGTAIKLKAPFGQIFGEPVYHEGSVLHLGYNSSRDETFLDIRDANNLEIQAKIWMGHYIPMGFHGNFIK